ncbi:MAG: hypothetical protein JNL97_07750, partial [Verrucomicrobiales bacterium]|nr:hypothetical protein [Verrucomicrobiales bacterium]
MNGPQHRHPRTASAIARRILWVILAVADGFAPTPSAFGLPPAERWLPTNTLAYVTVPNAAVARVAWQGQSPARLWADPAMRPFRRHVEDRWSALLADPLEKLTGFRFDELLGLAQGQCTLAWIEAAASGAAPAADRHVLLVDAGSDPTSLDTWWTCRDPALRVERFAASGASVVAVPLAPGTFDDLFRGFLPPLDSASARTTNASAPNALYVARHGNAILVTTSTNVLTHALPRLSEPTVPSPPSEVLRGTVSVPALLRHLPALPQVLGGFASSEAGAGLRGWASALGLGSLRQVAFAIRASPEGWASEVRLVVPSAARQGLFGMFALREAD